MHPAILRVLRYQYHLYRLLVFDVRIICAGWRLLFIYNPTSGKYVRADGVSSARSEIFSRHGRTTPPRSGCWFNNRRPFNFPGAEPFPHFRRFSRYRTNVRVLLLLLQRTATSAVLFFCRSFQARLLFTSAASSLTALNYRPRAVSAIIRLPHRRGVLYRPTPPTRNINIEPSRAGNSGRLARYCFLLTLIVVPVIP